MTECGDKYILGISAFFHDSAAALIKNGKVLFAVQEERFSRIKNDSDFPIQSIKFLLQESGINPDEIDHIVFYDKPWLKFERIIETSIQFAPSSFPSFLSAIPVWISKKFNTRKLLGIELSKISHELSSAEIKFSEHHFSHAASCFYTSPFLDACSVTIDGVGEWATISIIDFKSDRFEIKKEMNYPNSLGLLYSTFTVVCGFKVNSGEYKLMGLAPYGDIHSSQTKEYIKLIKSELVEIFPDGSLKLNFDYFSYTKNMQMINSEKFKSTFNLSIKDHDTQITQEYCNFALAAQTVTEEIIILIIREAKKNTDSKNLCLSGGVALNCVANSKICDAKIFQNIWIHPAPGDAGGAIGAALGFHFHNHEYLPSKKIFNPYIGPSFTNKEVFQVIKKSKIPFNKVEINDLFKIIAKEISAGKIIGWFQDRMEWGPRSLGNRSILADPRKIKMQKTLNEKIKFREGFRPFAPVVLEEFAKDYFEDSFKSPYMQYTFKVAKSKIGETGDREFFNRLQTISSPIPAVTHLDLSARVQTVNHSQNPKLFNLISEFKKITGVPLLINTSFNVRGEPIVCSPMDAINCFQKTEMDILVINNFLIFKNANSHCEYEHLFAEMEY